jgi:ABC-type nitrate/sulfonate/bicarbonate transport system substrate-binding protein
VLLDRVINGQLDGAHMLAATIGYGTEARISPPFSMDLNGNGLPVHPISALALKPMIKKYRAAVFKGIGVPVITDYEIWKNNLEKVFGISAKFTEDNPNTVLALTKALIRATKWLDENDNAHCAEAVEIMVRS